MEPSKKSHKHSYFSAPHRRRNGYGGNISLPRDQLGRFVPGHPGGPGRLKGKHDPVYMDIVAEVVSYVDWRARTEKVKRYALGGDRDLDALKFLAPYLLGRPAQAAPVEDENPVPMLDPFPEWQQEMLRFEHGIENAAEQLTAEKQNSRPASPSMSESKPAKE